MLIKNSGATHTEVRLDEDDTETVGAEKRRLLYNLE